MLSDYLHIKGPCFCPKSRKLRRIFLYTLAVNLFAVLISLLLPVIICFLIPIILRISFADDLVILGFIWSMTHPIINFSLTIIYVSPYREAVKKLLTSLETKYCLFLKNMGFRKVEEIANIRIQPMLLSSKITTTHSLCNEPGKSVNVVKQ
uniref:G-protein coupled receptors family 1 profile domain-containing protein n=1 Tax=Panagrolaimus davidi TaxID=227884 RepID=A0A914PL64_9BILA